MNLFSRLFDGLDDSSRLAIEAPDGGHISYGDLITWAGKMASVLVTWGVRPGVYRDLARSQNTP
jgi:malonyl-CoA/methylmalonyl-CoA synthetase